MYEHCPAWVMKEQYQPKTYDDGDEQSDNAAGGGYQQGTAPAGNPAPPRAENMADEGFDDDDDEEAPIQEPDPAKETKPAGRGTKRRGTKPKSNASPESQARIHDF